MARSTRSPIARFLAGAIAIGGAPQAFLLAAWPFEIGFPRGLLVWILFSPGWIAFFLLLWAAVGKTLPGDPFTTWIPCLLVNGFWLIVFGADTDFDVSSKAFVYLYVRAYVLAAVCASVIGLIVELRKRSPCEIDD